jgi:hypothetical protein
MANNPRRRNGNARDKLRRWLASQGNPCALCGGAIDYSLPAGDPMSFEMDEIIPVSRYKLGGYATPEQCALDRENVQAVHRICNQRRGNAIIIHRRSDGEDADRTPTSRDWGAT